MRIKKGSMMDIQLRVRNIAVVAAGVSSIVHGYNQKLKWDRRNKAGWFEVILGSACIVLATKSVLDDNFVPEKENKAPGMKDVSESTSAE